ncbi:MFS transporter [Dactylosporangium fulvum]|uniref:MFS transporter n=1 Tax=Dactylosporangium fulvum TaxID=53359 RepID=UPI0029D4195D|nr:MFS transporter [Dactylosporangium fulvum]
MLLPVPFVLFTADDRIQRADRPRFSLAGFWVSPRWHPDFAWAWITRFLIQLGNALGTLYLLYFLQDRVHLADPDTGLLVLILVYTVALMATTVFAGRRSDRTGRRRVFVIWSGIVMAGAALLLAFWPSWPVAVVAAAVLGVINIANSAPQVLGPALAAPIVVHLGGYPVLYVLTAVVTLLGSVFVLRIRSVP